jgi:hypothetical protein
LFHIYPALQAGVLSCINRDVLWALVWQAPDAEGASSGWVENMNARRFQDVRIEQCEAARRIKEEHGVKSAFRRKADDVRADGCHAPRIRARPTEVRRQDSAALQLGGDPRALGAYRTGRSGCGGNCSQRTWGFAVCPGNSCMPATQQSPQAPGINGRKACA